MQNSEYTWKKIGTTVLLDHPRLTVLEDDAELPNGHQTKYIYFDGNQDAVTVVVTRGDNILIQREYSYPPNEMLYQFPGGGIEGDETPEAGALRELREESGYTGMPHYLGFYYFNNRRSRSKMHIVHITNPTECNIGGW